MLTAVSAHADAKQFYGKVEAGLAMPGKLSDQTFEIGKKAPEKSAAFGAAVGYILPGEMMRLGLNLNYLSNSKTNGFDKIAGGVTTKVSQAKINSLSGDLNAYADIKDFNHITPYLTAGVGVARNSISGLKVS